MKCFSPLLERGRSLLTRKRVSFAVFARMGFLILLAMAGGCTSLQDWVHNGFKVGPNFQRTAGDVAVGLDRQRSAHSVHAPTPGNADDWWRVFNDPCLSRLIDTAYRQNLDLKTAAARVLEAQAQRNIAAGNLFPQSQNLIGDYAHAQIGSNLLAAAVAAAHHAQRLGRRLQRLVGAGFLGPAAPVGRIVGCLPLRFGRRLP